MGKSAASEQGWGKSVAELSLSEPGIPLLVYTVVLIESLEHNVVVFFPGLIVSI